LLYGTGGCCSITTVVAQGVKNGICADCAKYSDRKAA
jgi:hypothetical protein